MAEWLEGKPVLSNLPVKGYQDNLAVQSLVAYADYKLSAIAQQLQDFYKEVDPETAQDKHLDYLAFLVGLSGSYWDTRWPSRTKRLLISASHTYLWSAKGTLGVIKYVLDAHNISYDIWEDSPLRIPFKIPGKLGGDKKLRFFIRLDPKYSRTSFEWLEALRTARNFAPAVVEYKVCYKGFVIGASVIGDPIFRSDEKEGFTYLSIEGRKVTIDTETYGDDSKIVVTT